MGGSDDAERVGARDWFSGGQAESPPISDIDSVFWGLERSFMEQHPKRVRTKMSSSLRSDETFSQVREWIRRC
ncbi:hypothetical protein PMIN02_008285 [Paraphaeosphaeria minitans]